MFILKEAAHAGASPMPTVFAIFAAFWVFAILVLYFAVGALMRKAEKKAKH